MPGPILPVEKGQQVKNRGAKMTAKKRALVYPDDLEARGDDELWCKFCNVPVQHKEKSTALGMSSLQGTNGINWRILLECSNQGLQHWC